MPQPCPVRMVLSINQLSVLALYFEWRGDFNLQQRISRRFNLKPAPGDQGDPSDVSCGGAMRCENWPKL